MSRVGRSLPILDDGARHLSLVIRQVHAMSLAAFGAMHGATALALTIQHGEIHLVKHNIFHYLGLSQRHHLALRCGRAYLAQRGPPLHRQFRRRRHSAMAAQRRHDGGRANRKGLIVALRTTLA